MDRLPNAMFESDDSDLEEGPDVTRHKTKIIYQNTFPFIHMEPPDVLYERWCRIDPEVKKVAGHMMHISVFWWHILFRQQENHSTTAWAVAMGFLDSNVSNDLSLMRLHKIEILEFILDTVEKCLASTDPEWKARKIVSIGTSFKMTQQEGCFVDALRWLEDSGNPGINRKLMELGPKKIQLQVLEFVFFEYSRYIQVMSCSKKKMIRELAIQPKEWSIQKSEEMKNKGNLEFQRKKYDLALKWYTKAIKFHTNNHILYGNRAICYIRCEKYLKAMGDGKRAIILQRDWAKGHYRFCDALFLLGAKDKAVNANLVAQSYCSADSEGMRDLQQQYQRFMSEISEGSSKGRAPATSEGERRQKKTEAKKGSSKRAEGACGIDPPAHHGPSQKASEAPPAFCTAESKKTTEEIRNMQDPSGNSTTESYAGASLKVPKDAKSEMGDRKNKKGGQNSSEKHPVRTKHLPTQEKLQSSTSNSEVGSKEQFCTAVQDAHTALADQRCRNAEQAFSLALRIVNSSGTTALGISELDKALLMYGYATALIEIGQPEELFEAQKQFDKLKGSAAQFRTFQSLVHYGLGKVLLKENRFGDAFQEFSNAVLMVQRQITPGKLTWPTTKVTVQETQPEFLKDHLKSFIEMCKFPPKPDAICRHQHSQNQVAQIYFTDPDFKGFIRMSCCQSCKVEFHMSCWKKFKAVSFTDKNDKDFLQDLCFTPDCTGRICNIVIFDSTGLVKCEFKSSISKKPTQRPRVKQECTSLRKLKSKEDRKLRRKQNRAAVSVTKDETNDLPVENGASKKEKAVIQSSPKDSVVYGDRVLHQLYESRELFNDEICSISSILVCLKPWMDLSKAKAHVSMLTCQTEPKVLRDLVDVLLERKNRVWARIFIQNLSGYVDLKSKLHEWAQQLDNAGLKTAKQFISQCSDHLETLDLSSLLEFPPLKDLNEKFRPMQELLGAGFTVTDYLRQAPLQEMRLFIWTLEEHREHYPSCFTMLDEYFEMDAICLVIKKTEVDDHISSFSKCKSKQRKKKPKEPKSVLVLTGLRGGVLRDEDDFFSEEDSLMLLDSTDPFSVPDHLREEIAEFEEHYVSTGRTSQFSRYLDNNPDPATESLYDYFAQILEQHGPLEPTDPHLVSELQYFPSEARQKIEVAGGLELFLRGSLRFVKLNNLIGLMTQAVYLQDALDNDMQTLDDTIYATFSADDLESKGSTHLNPTAKEFLPHNNHFSPSDNGSSNNSAAFLSDNFLTETCSTLPSPYDLHSQNCAFVNETVKHELQGAMYPVYPYTSEKPGSKFNVSFYEGLSSKISPTSQTISVGTFREDIQDDVVINTEPYAPYEKNNGDITQMEKNNVKRQKEIQDMKETLELLQKDRDEACLAIEDEVMQIQMEMEVANKELNLFQEKLEEEVRKGQQEKKDQQEMVKALKGENKELTDLLDSYSKQIQAKNVEYEKELNHFLAISNQFETEKMSLEDEIKRYRVLCDKATHRSLAAQVNILQNKRDQGLRGMRKYMSNGKVILQSMAEFSTRYPSEGLYSAIQDWTAFVKDVEEKISMTTMQYEEQIKLVKKGTRLSSLPQVSVPSARVPPLVPAYVQPSSIQHPVPHNLPVRHPQPQGPYGVQQHHVRPLAPTPPTHPTDRATHSPSPVYEGAVPSATPVTPVQPQPQAVFERMVDRLSNMFPHYSRKVLSGFIREVRVNNGGMLNNLTYDQVINRAAQLILDHQESSQAQNFVSGDALGVREGGVPSPTPVDFSRGTATPPPTQAWKNVSSQNRNSNRALNFEDPCIICHDDMAQEDVCVLECRHSFHRECIKSWLKEQSTCPTCREHALLPEDFPMLPGRNRRGHAAASSNS